jgi:hypothetical protein
MLGYDHQHSHLAWKSWIFIHDHPCCEGFLHDMPKSVFIISPLQILHIKGHNAKWLHFVIFSLFVFAMQGQNHWQNYLLFEPESFDTVCGYCIESYVGR